MFLKTSAELRQLGSLTWLVLDCGRQSVQINQADLLEMFRNNPGLRTVKIRDNLLWNTGGFIPAKPRLKLSSLEEFTLHHSYEADSAFRLLGLIEVPFGARLDICVLDLWGAYVDVPQEDRLSNHPIRELARDAAKDNLRYVQLNGKRGEFRVLGWLDGDKNNGPPLALRIRLAMWTPIDRLDGACIRLLGNAHSLRQAPFWKVTGVFRRGWKTLLGPTKFDGRHLRLNSQSFSDFLWYFGTKNAPMHRLAVLAVEEADLASDVRDFDSTCADLLLLALDMDALRPAEVCLLGCRNIPDGFSDTLLAYESIQRVVISELHLEARTVDNLGVESEAHDGDDEGDDWLHPRDEASPAGWF